MITADMRNYDYYLYGAVDAYGQQQLSYDVQGSIKMAIYTSTQSIQDNINYKDCSYIGLTFDNITDAFVIKYNEEKLKVLYVNPVGRNKKQVFLKKI